MEIIDIKNNEKGESKMVKYFAVCPLCGYKLLKGAEGTRVEMMCPKCHEEVVVTINKEFVQTAKGRTKQKNS
jgi:phage FluMu protein Com